MTEIGCPRGTGRRRPATATLSMLVLLLAAGCGGGNAANEVVQGRASSLEVSTVPTSAADAATTSSTPPAASSTTAPTTGPAGRAATTVVRRTDPPPPQPPISGTLAPAPTVRAVTPYLPPGFVDQVNPPSTEAYTMLREGRCSELLNEIAAEWKLAVAAQDFLLYRAAGQACLSRWAGAENDFRQVATGPAFATAICTFEVGDPACVQARTLVRDWTAALLGARRADPNFVPNFSPPPK